MNQLNRKLITLTGFVCIASISGLSQASDSWTGFVPPKSNQYNAQQAQAVDSGNWQNDRWRTGSSFNTPHRFKFTASSSEVVDAKEYAKTQPARKSVNPWTVNRFNKKHYGFGPAKRPWGSVPEEFQKRANRAKIYRTPAAGANAFLSPQAGYRPYMNNNLLNSSSSLLPMAGFLPIYSNPAYINSVPFFGPRYGYGYGSRYPGAYLWR